MTLISGSASQIYDSILDTIGKTPIVKLNTIAPEGINLYAKCEFFNPLSSVKVRFFKSWRRIVATPGGGGSCGVT